MVQNLYWQAEAAYRYIAQVSRKMEMVMKGYGQRVRPTLEVIVTESPAHLRKIKDDETGLALIRPAARRSDGRGP
jgi:hypothetical protein